MKRAKIIIFFLLFIFLFYYSLSGDFLDLFKRAHNALNQKDYTKAVEYFSKALELPTRPSEKI